MRHHGHFLPLIVSTGHQKLSSQRETQQMGKRWCNYLISLLWTILMAQNAIGQSVAGFSVYEDISHQWLIYDYTEKMYVPYLPGVHPPTRYLHVVLQPASWKPAKKLVIPVEKETLLFIDNNLSHHIRQRQTLIWDLDSLAASETISLLTYVSVRPVEKAPSLLLSGQQYNLGTSSNAPIKRVTPDLSSNKDRQEQNTTLRRSMEQKNYLLAAALACSIMLATFSLINSKYVSVKDSLQMLFQLFKYREVQEKTDLRSLLTFWLIFAVVATYLLMLVADYSMALIHFTAISHGDNLFVSSYLKIGAWLLLFLLLKYLLIELLDGVFTHRILAEKHTAISFHIYKIFILLTFTLFLGYHMSHYYQVYISPHVLYYTLMWGWIAVTAIAGIVLYLSVTQRFIYLIAYLCTTEVLPLLLVLKLFLIPS